MTTKEISLIDVLTTLPKLEHAELMKVRAAIDHIAGKRKELNEDGSSLLYSILVDKLGLNVSYARFKKGNTYYNGWRAGSGITVSFMKQHFKHTTKAEQIVVLGNLVELVMSDLRTRKAPVTLGVVVLNLCRVPMLFEDAYPGYLQSGIAGLVFNKMTGRK